MVTKRKAAQKSRKVKVDKLKLTKDTVKDLTGSAQKKVKGGVANIEVHGSGPFCTKDYYCVNYPTRKYC